MRSAFVTDYHRPNQREYDLQECNGCNHTFDSKDVRRSVMTGEILCCKGEKSCWNEAKETHEAQSLEWHGVVTGFE